MTAPTNNITETSGFEIGHPSPSTDILHGADAIAQFLYGNTKQRRKIYHMAEHGYFPHFRLGTMICARQSTLINWIATQELNTTHRIG